MIYVLYKDGLEFYVLPTEEVLPCHTNHPCFEGAFKTELQAYTRALEENEKLINTLKHYHLNYKLNIRLASKENKK